MDYPFVQDTYLRKRFHENGQLALTTALGEYVTFNYHFFNTTYNIFVLLMPPGQRIRSRTVIVSR